MWEYRVCLGLSQFKYQNSCIGGNCSILGELGQWVTLGSTHHVLSLVLSAGDADVTKFQSL